MFRFVKDRRPSISPNFNFLGQLQHFQGSLRHKSSDGSLVIQPLSSPNANACPLPSPGPALDYQGNLLPARDTGPAFPRAEPPTPTEETPQRCSRRGEEQKDPSEAAAVSRSLSRKLQTLNLTLNLTPSVLTPSDEPSGCRKPTPPAVRAPAPPQLLLPPTGHASLQEKRRSLTLSLSSTVNTLRPVATPTPTPDHPVTTPTPTPDQPHPATPQTRVGTASTPASQTAHAGSAAQYPDPPAEVAVESAAPEARGRRQRGSASSSCRRTSRPAQGSPQGPAPPGGRAQGGRAQGKSAGVCSPIQAPNPSQKKKSNRRRQLHIPIIPILTTTTTATTTTTSSSTTIVDQQPSAENKKASSTLGPEENVVEDQSPLSPLNLTLNKLLGWGERMLLGVLLGPQIKMGQAALPYRC